MKNILLNPIWKYFDVSEFPRNQELFFFFPVTLVRRPPKKSDFEHKAWDVQLSNHPSQTLVQKLQKKVSKFNLTVGKSEITSPELQPEIYAYLNYSKEAMSANNRLCDHTAIYTILNRGGYALTAGGHLLWNHSTSAARCCCHTSNLLLFLSSHKCNILSHMLLYLIHILYGSVFGCCSVILLT